MAHCVAGGGGGGRTQLLVTVEMPAMTVLTVSSPVFSSPGSLLSIPILLFDLPLFLLLSCFFFSFLFFCLFCPLFL